MTRFPGGFRLERLRRDHPRKDFDCGEVQVNDWLAAKALQNQDKHLAVTRVLLAPTMAIAGYYTLAVGQVDFGELPTAVAKKLPKRLLPVAVLAWLGVSRNHQGQGLGGRLLAQALRDCHAAGQTFPFVGVLLDCISDAARVFYLKWDFEPLPGHPYRLFLSAKRLELMMQN